MALRVLFISFNSYFNPTVGATKLLKSLTKQLDDKGLSIDFLSLANPDVLKWRKLNVSSKTRTASFQAGNDYRVHLYIPPKNEAVEAHFLMALSETIKNCKPTVIVLNDSYFFSLTFEVLRFIRTKYKIPTIFFNQNASYFPFGPGAVALKSGLKKNLKMELKKISAVICPSKFLSRYIKKYSGLKAFVLYPPVFQKVPKRKFSNFKAPYVTMVNPCEMKGLSIFLAIAEGFPKQGFLAVKGWNTTDSDLRKLAKYKNIKVIEGTPDMEPIYKQTRILLAPSLISEAFGLTPLEAKLRGIPALASNQGGLPEATVNRRFVIPVNPSYLSKNGVRKYPRQNYKPWIKTIGNIFKDRTSYERESKSACKVSRKFVQTIGVDSFIRLLERASRLEAGFKQKKI